MTAPVLSDGWPDEAPQKRVWVSVDLVPEGGDAAIVAARSELDYYAELLDEDGFVIVPTGGREWHRESPCMECDGSGADDGWRRLMGFDEPFVEGPAPACECCGGDGRQTGDEGYAYERCEPGVEGAAEFWVLEVRESVAP